MYNGVIASITAFDKWEWQFWKEHFEESYAKTNDSAYKEVLDEIMEHKDDEYEEY